MILRTSLASFRRSILLLLSLLLPASLTGSESIKPPAQPAAQPMATLVSDTFTDTNGTDLAAHSPDTDVIGWAWEEWRGAWDIQSNATRSTSNSTNWDMAVINAGRKDIDVTISFTTHATLNTAISIIVRARDLNNHWYIRNQTNQDTLYISDRIAGTPTDRASGAATMDVNTSYTLRVTTSGDTINAYWNGAGSPTATYTSASFLNEQPIIGISTWTQSGVYGTATFDSITATGAAMPSTQTEWADTTGAKGEHPVIKNSQLYVTQFDPSTATDGGINIYEPYEGILLNRIVISSTQLASAAAIDNNNKILLWATGTSGATASVRRVSRYGTIEETATGLLAIDWEALVYNSANNWIFTIGSGSLSARDASSLTTVDWTAGSINWSGQNSSSPILVHGSYVYVFDQVSTLWKLNLSDGTGVDSIDISAAAINAYTQMIYDSARDDIYISDDDGRTVFSVDVSGATLATNWNVTLGSAGDDIYRGGCYHNDVLYMTAQQQAGTGDGGRRSKIYALDVTNSGATLWTNTTAYDNDAHVSSLVCDARYVYATTYDYIDGNYEKLLVIDNRDGTIVTSYTLNNGPSSAIPAVWGGYFVIGLWDSDDGVQVIQVQSGGATDDFPWKADSDYTGYVGVWTGITTDWTEAFQPRGGVAIYNGITTI